jgi:hypothetical protein
VAGSKYDLLKSKQTELIRKALDGSAFIASADAPALDQLTDAADSLLKPLPTGGSPAMPWGDLGWLSADGAQFSRDVSSSDITSWGSVSPTRSDVTADSSTLTVACQETNIRTIGLSTGMDMSGITPSASGEVQVQKPSRPSSRFYRVLSLAVDQGDAGEIYIARYMPRAKVTGFSEQAFGGGDDPIMWGVTFTGYEDSDEGFSESWIFGGPGWKALLEDMGFPAAGA